VLTLATPVAKGGSVLDFLKCIFTAAGSRESVPLSPGTGGSGSGGSGSGGPFFLKLFSFCCTL